MLDLQRKNIFPAKKESSENYLTGARVFIFFTATMGVLWAFLYRLLFSANVVSLIIAVSCVIGYGIFLLSFRVKNPAIISHLTIADFAIVLCLIEFFTGGINSPTDNWFMIVPVVAFFFGGLKQGVIWTGFVIVVICLFEILSMTGIKLPQPISGEENRLWVFLKIISAFLVMAGIAAAYEYVRSSFEKNLRDKADKLIESQERLKKTLDYIKKLNSELTRINEVRSEFTAMVTHELRTPLTAIKEGVNMVLEGVAGEVSGKQKMFLETASRNVNRLSKLVNDVLDIERFESGKIDFYFKPNDLNFVVDQVVKDMTTLAGSKGLYLKAELEKNIPSVIFDHDKIIQVLANLIGNAVKFTKSGGIIVSTKDGEKFVTVSVKDTGTGIKQADIPTVFDSYTRVFNGREQSEVGSGLGLFISKKIIAKHQGNIWVESKEGEGAVFSFSLPKEKLTE